MQADEIKATVLVILSVNLRYFEQRTKGGQDQALVKNTSTSLSEQNLVEVPDMPYSLLKAIFYNIELYSLPADTVFRYI